MKTISTSELVAGMILAEDVATLKMNKLLDKGTVLTNKEIAKILYVSVHTVKSNIEAILRILDAKNRTNTVYIAMKNNLIK